jgi:hypothetical protein
MKIHAGYDISYDCLQPTPMILTLSVHPSRRPTLLTPDRMLLDPLIPTKEIPADRFPLVARNSRGLC